VELLDGQRAGVGEVVGAAGELHCGDARAGGVVEVEHREVGAVLPWQRLPSPAGKGHQRAGPGVAGTVEVPEAQDDGGAAAGRVGCGGFFRLGSVIGERHGADGPGLGDPGAAAVVVEHGG